MVEQTEINVQTEQENSFFTGFNLDCEEDNFNSIFPFEIAEEKYQDVIFPFMHISEEEIGTKPKIDAHSLTSYDNNESLLDKLTSFIDNYNTILNNESAVKSPNNFEENLKLAENTLSGSIISLMMKKQQPIGIEEIYEDIKGKFQNFRKANGAKYSEDALSVIKSTLKSSNIFFKIEENKYFFKEKESMDFIIKNMERELKKRANKDKKETKSKISKKSSQTCSSTKTKTKKSELSFSAQMSFKICKINSILDHMVQRYRGDSKYAKLKMANHSSIEMLKEFCEKDRFIGMLMCIKYFKNLSKFFSFTFIVEKYVKYVNRKKNVEHFFDLNKINEKIIQACDKIEQLEKRMTIESKAEHYYARGPDHYSYYSSNDKMDIDDIPFNTHEFPK